MAELSIIKKMQPVLSPSRLKILRGGRCSGKSFSIAGILVCKAAEKPMRILCCREVQKSIKQSVHQLLVDQIKRIGLESFYKITEQEIRGVNGSLFIFAGLRDLGIAQIKSLEGVDVAWVEESQSITQKSIDTLFPTIRKPGSEIWMIYNPYLDNDPVHQLAENVKKLNDQSKGIVIDVNIEDNPWASKEMYDLRDQAYMEDPIKAAQIWAGKTRPSVEGAIYEKQLDQMRTENRICNVPYQPSSKVIVAFDFGIGDNTAIVVGQYIGLERRIIMTYENNGEQMGHYIEWLRRLPYDIDVFELPHDARSRSMATNSKTKYEEIRNAFPRATINCPNGASNAPRLEDGIDNVKKHFNELYIDQKLESLIIALQRYKREYDEKTGIFGKPEHDTPYSHIMDALRYWMLHKTVTRLDASKFLTPQNNIGRTNPFRS